MKKWSIGLLVCGMILIGSLRASAQMYPLLKEFTAFGGMTFNGSDEATAGGALAINISPRVGVEGEGSLIMTSDTLVNVNADIMLNLGTGMSPIVPYIIGGAGVLNNGGTHIALNAGMGFKLFIEPNIAFRIDFRGFFTSEGGDIEDLERIYGGLIFFF